MKARSPIDGKYYFFIDNCLPFGAAISCAIFQRVSSAIAHIVKFKTKKELINYLDDFLFVQLLRILCNRQVSTFLQVCKEINFPISGEKTFWSTTQMTFLGFLIDTVRQMVSIPWDKVEKGKALISNVPSKENKRITVAQLQRVTGFLNFLCRCVVPGRAFTRRLYSFMGGNKLKPHHHIRVNSEMRRDLEMWLIFLDHPSSFCRPFIDY